MHLLNKLKTQSLILTIPTSKPIFKKRTQKSTIDLIFIYKALIDRLAFYRLKNTQALTADRILAWITLNANTPMQQTHQRYATQKFNQVKYFQEITNRLIIILKVTLKDIQRIISNYLEEYYLKAQSYKHARRRQSLKAVYLLIGTRWVRRQYSIIDEDYYYQSYKALKNRLKKIIRKENRNSQR